MRRALSLVVLLPLLFPLLCTFACKNEVECHVFVDKVNSEFEECDQPHRLDAAEECPPEDEYAGQDCTEYYKCKTQRTKCDVDAGVEQDYTDCPDRIYCEQ